MSNFHLKDEDDSFKLRSDDIFGSFDSIKCQASKSDTVSLRKRQLPADDQATTKIPGYTTEPHKWTKYDLDSTHASDDRQNTCTALNFLHDLAKQKVECIDKKDSADLEKKSVRNEKDINPSHVCFKKPNPVECPEYVVGSKSRKQNVAKLNKPDASFDKVELQHLEESVSALEYQAAIEAKLEESIELKQARPKSQLNKNSNVDEGFKLQKSLKQKRVLRKRDVCDD